ncbi:MAG: 16S rRNA (uracil(1498)-N(3))-methyltransferase [Bacilli bacterium]
MQRYFIKNNQHHGNIIEITGLDFHHMTHVMRMTINSRVIVIDENAVTYETKIINISKNDIILEIINEKQVNNELPIDVTIAFGLTKYPKIEEVIRRITELGAKKFVAVEMERSNLRLNKLPQLKNNRWELIVKEASEQSERTKLMEIAPFLSFQSFVEQSSNYDLRLFAYEESGKQKDYSFKNTLEQFKGKSILVLVGPEGGITELEAKTLITNGFTAVGLGSRILRCETAPLYLMSVISFIKEFSHES